MLVMPVFNSIVIPQLDPKETPCITAGSYFCLLSIGT